MRIDRDVILVTRQHLAESVEAHLPGAQIPDQRFLEARAESWHPRAAIPSRALRSSLESIPALEIGVLRLDVSESRNVDRIGTTPNFAAILRPRQLSNRAATHDVIHQVV